MRSIIKTRKTIMGSLWDKNRLLENELNKKQTDYYQKQKKLDRMIKEVEETKQRYLDVIEDLENAKQEYINATLEVKELQISYQKKMDEIINNIK